MTVVQTCCLCDEEFTGFGNNPAPLAQHPKRCCDDCNTMLVIPERIAAAGRTVSYAAQIANLERKLHDESTLADDLAFVLNHLAGPGHHVYPNPEVDRVLERYQAARQ